MRYVNFSKWKKTKIFVLFSLVLLVAVFLLSRGHNYEKEEIEYGVTFSKKQAENLGLDWQKVYLDILDDLKIKKLRLPAYWDEVEKEKDNFNWEDLDWQIDEAAKRGGEIILAVGGRLPRWPECHFPAWRQSLSEEDKEKEILDYLRAVITRYQRRAEIIAWQVENEPFLPYFGECPEPDIALLDKEIALVRSLDARPVVVTDSGELSLWVRAARRADIFGTTMYCDTYSRVLKNYIHYPIGPGFFHFKKNIVSLFAKPQKWVVIEMQAEPWGAVSYENLNQAEKDRTMSLQKFKEMFEFSRRTGFREFYLWGAEWWYWEKNSGNPLFLEEAKKIINKE